MNDYTSPKQPAAPSKRIPPPKPLRTNPKVSRKLHFDEWFSYKS